LKVKSLPLLLLTYIAHLTGKYQSRLERPIVTWL
jgi:hypothetical protein